MTSKSLLYASGLVSLWQPGQLLSVAQTVQGHLAEYRPESRYAAHISEKLAFQCSKCFKCLITCVVIHSHHNVSKLFPPNSCVCSRGIRWLSIIWVWFCRWGKLLPKYIIQRWLHLHHTVRRLRWRRDNYANFGRSERERIFLLWYPHESRRYFIQLNMVGFHW